MPKLTCSQIKYFWSLVNISNSDNCWNWQGSIFASGYGCIHFAVGRKNYFRYRVHRLAYYSVTGIDPRNKLVCHTCDNKKCCNPSHLFLGTSAENSLDMKNKNRAARQPGEKHGMAKLTINQVLEIRASNLTPTIISPVYKICPSLVSQIRRRKIWRHI